MLNFPAAPDLGCTAQKVKFILRCNIYLKFSPNLTEKMNGPVTINSLVTLVRLKSINSF